MVDTAKALLGKQPNQGVNPDEVVAIGAAIQGGVLRGEEGLDDVLLLDVTPLSLGIETEGGISTPLIERNSTIPTKKSQIFSTAADNQPGVDVKVLQGERRMANANKLIGNFRLDGIPPAARGMPQIEVTFDIDANGILHVSAKDKGTGKEQKITITHSSGLSEDEIEQMKKDAEEHAEDDKKQFEAAESRNLGENLVYAAEKLVKENDEKLPEEKKATVETEVEALKEALKGDDVEKIKEQTEKLQAALQEASADMYKAATEEAQQGQATAGDGGEDQPSEDAPKDEGPVVDAEVVDEEKK
ncbi:MAG: hypothetical protein CMO64_07190 [Verrucomicrobiales bacterium]|nr:hypothetical protein [Verrucomicrobiales bacterium]